MDDPATRRRTGEIRLLQATLDKRYCEWKIDESNSVRHGRAKGLAEALGILRHNTEAEELAAAEERYENLPDE